MRKALRLSLQDMDNLIVGLEAVLRKTEDEEYREILESMVGVLVTIEDDLNELYVEVIDSE